MAAAAAAVAAAAACRVVCAADGHGQRCAALAERQSAAPELVAALFDLTVGLAACAPNALLDGALAGAVDTGRAASRLLLRAWWSFSLSRRATRALWLWDLFARARV